MQKNGKGKEGKQGKEDMEGRRGREVKKGGEGEKWTRKGRERKLEMGKRKSGKETQAAT